MKGVVSATDDQIRIAYQTKSIRQIQKEMKVGIRRVRKVVRGVAV